MKLTTITEIARFHASLRTGERVIVLAPDHSTTLAVGTPRGIVEPDSYGFASDVTEASRYWITDIRGTEHFIPIGTVMGAEVYYVSADQAADYDRELR